MQALEQEQVASQREQTDETKASQAASQQGQEDVHATRLEQVASQ